MPAPAFDRYLRYEELAAFLHALAREHPHLVSVASIGKSHEGRDLWVATVTNTTTGPADEKPAYWIDGNIHATEVAASAAPLYFLHTLVTKYGSDADVTRALDTRAFYVLPRMNPDGAEWALADQPRFIRSTTRPYPFDEEELEGLVVEDIDRNGEILQMRIVDPNGLWKGHPDDARLMVRRDPVETGGTYYRVLPEGRYDKYDGHTLTVKRRKEGLDLNRNFPASWRQEFEQLGAGPYPTSEPEVRAVVDFFTTHPNICGGTSIHTFSGVLLRPFGHAPDDKLPAEDLWTYQAVGKKGEELTGYPAISIWHEFQYYPGEFISGAFDWIYEHLGMYIWTIEIWNPKKEAGIDSKEWIHWFRDHPIEDDLKVYDWAQRVAPGEGHVAWKPFDHPQLGKVEIGGWNRMAIFTNPPPALREKEIARFPKWLLWQTLISPKLEVREVQVASAGNDAWRVRLILQNTGWLPSYVSKMATKRNLLRGVLAEIDLPDGARLLSGKAREELGELEGWAYLHTGISFWPTKNVTADRAHVDWVVQGKAGSTVRLKAWHERAGLVEATARLG
jgi:murein tripeptide amidase MpaA